MLVCRARPIPLPDATEHSTMLQCSSRVSTSCLQIKLGPKFAHLQQEQLTKHFSLSAVMRDSDVQSSVDVLMRRVRWET